MNQLNRLHESNLPMRDMEPPRSRTTTDRAVEHADRIAFARRCDANPQAMDRLLDDLVDNGDDGVPDAFDYDEGHH